MKDRIIAYLAAGLKPANISTIVGCSPAYISQLLSDPEFKAKVEAKMLDGTVEVDTSLDMKYESLEHGIIKNMEAALTGAELPHLIRALEVVNKGQDMRAKRKNPALREPSTLVQVVQISIPQHAMVTPVMNLNSNSEVIAIDNKPLAPMNAAGVKELFAKRVAQKEKDHEHVSSIANETTTATLPADF